MMRRTIRSKTYARARLVTGTIAAGFGLAIIVRTALAVGFDSKAVPAYVLGFAMVALAIVRYREYALAVRASKENTWTSSRT